MHFHVLDNYSHLDSPIHRVPAALKMLAAVAVVLAVISVPLSHPIVLAVIAFALLMIAAASQLPGAFLVKRILLLEPFVLGIALLSLLQPHGPLLFLSLVVRSTLSMFTLILLANTTPFGQMILVLRKVRLPSLLITTLALMHRYLFVLLDESRRMRRARLCRTFTRRKMSLHTLSSVCSQLFIRSSDRAERVYAAMCSRGWR